MNDLVLLHGALGAATQLDPLRDVLQETFRVHQMDFEGHANTPARDRPFRIRHFVENAIDLLDTRGIERAQFFGYSMGGYVALSLALERPDRVDAVATLGTKFRWDPATASRESARLDPATIRCKVPKFAHLLEQRHAGAGGWEKVLGRTADFLRDLGDGPVLTDATLSRITQRTRIIVGDRDNTVNVEEAHSIGRILPGGTVTVLANTPHPVEQVSVPALATVLLDFFGPTG